MSSASTTSCECCFCSAVLPSCLVVADGSMLSCMLTLLCTRTLPGLCPACWTTHDLI